MEDRQKIQFEVTADEVAEMQQLAVKRAAIAELQENLTKQLASILEEQEAWWSTIQEKYQAPRGTRLNLNRETGIVTER